MPANIRETFIAFGETAQADLTTRNADGTLIHLSKLNASLNDPELVVENDATEIGKGDEFAAHTFKSHQNVSGQLEKYLSSEMAGWVFAFGLGKSTASTSGVGAIKHQAVLLKPATDGINMVPFTFIEQIRVGGSPAAVVDRAAIGCVIEDFSITVGSGPGRQNAKLSVNFVGTGKLTEPSTATIPAATTEHLLPAGSMTLTLNGVDYVGNKNIVSAEFSYKNNVRAESAFFPGSGFATAGDSTSGQVRGRQEYGDREIRFRFVVRSDENSTELTKLRAQTEGAIAWYQKGQLIVSGHWHDMSIAAPRVVFEKVQTTEANGIVTASIDVLVLKPTDSSEILTCYATNGIALMGAET